MGNDCDVLSQRAPADLPERAPGVDSFGWRTLLEVCRRYVRRYTTEQRQHQGALKKMMVNVIRTQSKHQVLPCRFRCDQLSIREAYEAADMKIQNMPLPTPIRSPDLTLKETFFRISGPLIEYFADKFLTSRSPLVGQVSDSGVVVGSDMSSCSMARYCWIRSRLPPD